MNKKYGFTLVELLVVIAILAILLLLTVPAISSVRASAASTKSAANLRQIVTATKLWSIENDGRAMSRFIGSTHWPNVLIRDGFLTVEIFKHPSDNRETMRNMTYPLKLRQTSYGINFRTFGVIPKETDEPVKGGTAYVPIKELYLSSFKTGNLVYFAESGGNDPDLVQALVYPDDGESWHMVNFRNRKTANAAFFDGSVRPVTKEQVRNVSDPRGLWSPRQRGNGRATLFQ